VVYSYKQDPVAKRGKKASKEGETLHIARISVVISNLLKKIDHNTATTSAHIAEPKHYEQSLLKRFQNRNAGALRRQNT
jgi:hypothetical protein